jgi:putative DNA primase/helicase
MNTKLDKNQSITSGDRFDCPLELRLLPQWVAWRFEQRDGKPTKVPIDARTRGRASTTDHRTWADYGTAYAAYQRFRLDGIGFVFSTSDPYSGVDLDNCRNPESGEIAEWAWAVICELNSYTEISPSGTGVKIWVKGKLPPGARNRTKFASGEIEIYSRGRYFTVTGWHLSNTPPEIGDRQAELTSLHAQIFATKATKLNPMNGDRRRFPVSIADADLVSRASAARNGGKFSRLWNGVMGDYDGDESRADMALCDMLAFWTGRDPARMDRLFRASGLYREKWEREDYRTRTLESAIDRANAVWTPSRRNANASLVRGIA